jgi:hypothetical protein
LHFFRSFLKNLLQTKKERTNHSTEQPASHFFVTGQRNEPNENMFRCAKQHVFLARKASIAQSANEKRCAHGAAAPKYPAASRANADAPRRLIRTRLPDSGKFAFAASKRTAKSEKLTRVGIEALSGLFGENSLRFEPRGARI